MDFHEIITRALGLQGAELGQPEFFDENLSVTLKITWPFHLSRCAVCDDFLLQVHSWLTREVRAPSFFVYEIVTLKVRYARGLCRSCNKVRVSRLPFVHPKFGSMTLGLAERAGQMMEEMTCAAAARLLRLNEKTLWRLDRWRMEKMHGQIRLKDLIKDLDLRKMSADEVHFKTVYESKRDHPFSPHYQVKFVTNLVCTKEAKVIANAAGRDARSLANCLKELSKPQRLSVEFFSIDMNPGYFKAVTKLCPNAEIAIDRFHLIQILNERFDLVRREEFYKAKRSRNDFQATMLGPTKKFILCERNAVRSMEEDSLLGKLRMLNDNIHNAMLIVDYFHKVLDEKGVANFRRRLADWYGLTRKARLKPLTQFALMVMRYRKNIEAYIKSNLTTAISEGLNNKIRVLKAMAYGYKNERSFMLKILQRCGFLNSKFIDTRRWFFEPAWEAWHET
jgi:transposase